MRIVKICYSSDDGTQPIYETASFEDSYSDFDIDDYCYDIVEKKYNNEKWFSWESYDELF